MGYFPFFTDIENKNCLIVGGGSVAARKIKKLIPYSPVINVIAKDVCDEIYDIKYKNLFIYNRIFSPTDIENNFFVIAATDDPSLNHTISVSYTHLDVYKRQTPDIASDDTVWPTIIVSAIL